MFSVSTHIVLIYGNVLIVASWKYVTVIDYNKTKHDLLSHSFIQYVTHWKSNAIFKLLKNKIIINCQWAITSINILCTSISDSILINRNNQYIDLLIFYLSVDDYVLGYNNSIIILIGN